MKKILVLILAVVTVFSCGDDLQFNSPALQGKKDGELWKAVFFNAIVEDGGRLVITGGNNFETVILEVPSTALGTYTLGENSSSEARFLDFNGLEYSTLNLPDSELTVYPPDGEISLTSYDSENSTISGEFHFNAYSNDGLKTVNFSQGIFFDLPIPFSSTNILSCDDASSETDSAREAYLAADPTDPDSNYSVKCNAYKNALIDQQTACGDDLGVLQDIIDGLLCNDDDDDTVLTVVEDLNGDGDPTNDDSDGDDIPNYLDTDDDNDSLLTINEDPDGDGNVLNDDTDVDSIPNYLDDDDDGDGILTIDEDVDGDGDVTNDDSDGDGTPDYLDNN